MSDLFPHDAREQYFGAPWGNVTDDCDPISTPVGETCMGCQEAFEEGDQGIKNLSGWSQHRECGLRMAMGGIGHHVDHARYCPPSGVDPDAGLPRRVSAILVWGWVVNNNRYTVEDIEALRRTIGER